MCQTYHGKITPSPVQSITHAESVKPTCTSDIASDLRLEQMVNFPTRGDNSLDIIFTSHPSVSLFLQLLPRVTVLFDTAHQPVRARPKRRTIILWKKSDTDGIVSLLQPTVKGFLTYPSPLATVFEAVDRAISDHVPTKCTPAYHKARQTKNPIDWDRYKRLRTQTQKDIRSAHKKYMEEIVSNDL